MYRDNREGKREFVEDLSKLFENCYRGEIEKVEYVEPRGGYEFIVIRNRYRKDTVICVTSSSIESIFQEFAREVAGDKPTGRVEEGSEWYSKLARKDTK